MRPHPLRALGDGSAFVFTLVIQMLNLQGQAWMLLKARAMLLQKLPIQGGKGTGVFCFSVVRLVPAVIAIIAHFGNVATRGDVGLGGHYATIGVLAHP